MNVKGFLFRFWTNVETREKLVRAVLFYQAAIYVFETNDEIQELSKGEEESQKKRFKSSSRSEFVFRD